MSRYDETPESYTIEQIEEKLPFLKNAEIKNAKIKINKNNKLYWENGDFHNGIFENSFWKQGNFYNEKFINSYWNYGGFKGGTFINSYWREGFFTNGTFIKSYYKDGDFYNGIFINSYWEFGVFRNGKFINSYWNKGYILGGNFINSIISYINYDNEFKDYSKAKFHNCIILYFRLLKLNRTYSKLTFKGIE